MSRYQVWNKVDQVITPSGKVFTAEEWANKYPMSKIEGIDLVISGGTINGAFCGELTSMSEMYDKDMKRSKIEGFENGIPKGLSKQEVLDFIEAFEDARNSQPIVAPVTAEDRIAAALEAQVMMALPDAE